MSIDLYDTWTVQPNDEQLQRLAARYVVDRVSDEKAALEVLAMLFAPVRS